MIVSVAAGISSKTRGLIWAELIVLTWACVAVAATNVSPAAAPRKRRRSFRKRPILDDGLASENCVLLEFIPAILPEIKIMSRGNSQKKIDKADSYISITP